MNPRYQLYYLLGYLESTAFKENISPVDLKIVQEIIQSNKYFQENISSNNPLNLELEDDVISYEDDKSSNGADEYGYNSWEEMAFQVAFEGNPDAWNHYNE